MASPAFFTDSTNWIYPIGTAGDYPVRAERATRTNDPYLMHSAGPPVEGTTGQSSGLIRRISQN